MADPPEFAGSQVHAPLEQDDGDPQANELGQLGLRHADLDDTSDRAQQQARGNQHDDGRQFDPRGQPLAGQASGQDHQ